MKTSKKIVALAVFCLMVFNTVSVFAADRDVWEAATKKPYATALDMKKSEAKRLEVRKHPSKYYFEANGHLFTMEKANKEFQKDQAGFFAKLVKGNEEVMPVPAAELAVASVSAITKKTISVEFNHPVNAGESMNEIVVVAPNGNELIATGIPTVGDKTATYTFQYELNQTGTYTVKGTEAKIDYVTAIQDVQTKIKEDNSVYVTGKTVLADAVQISVDGESFVNATLSAEGEFSYTTPIMPSGEQQITIKAVKGTTVVQQKVTVMIPTADQVSVVSAKAINSREVEVVFSQKVEKSSAEQKANYKVTYDIAADNRVDQADLMPDEKTVILTIDSDGGGGVDVMANGKPYAVKSIKDVLTKTNNQKMVPYKGEAQLFSNTKGPKLLSVMKTTDNKFVLAFDKHVKNTAKVRVDGIEIGVGSVTAPKTNAGDYTLTTDAVTAAQAALVKPGVHTVVVADAEDVAGVKTTVQQLAFSISSDTTAPSVKQVTPVAFNAFEIQFSEPITNIADLDGLITGEHFKVSKGNFIYPYTVGNTATDGFKSANRVDGKENTYKVIINEKVKVGSIYYDLYDEGMSNVTLNISVKGYKDTVGLVGNLYNGTVTLQKESEAPYVLSENLNTVAGNDLKIKFNEELKGGAADIDKTKIFVYNGSNVKLAFNAVALDVANKDVVKITFGAAPPKHKIKVVFEQDAVQDLMGNTNNALTTYVDNRAAAAPLTIAQVHADGHAASVGNGLAGVQNADKNVITINYNVEMDDNAILAANYELDGAPLPVGTKVEFTDADKKIVTITLPEELYTVKVKAVLTLKTAITTADGSKFVATATYDEVSVPVALSDNVKPILTKAQFVAGESDTATKAIELTFSETLTAITADDPSTMDDFVVIIGGAEYKVVSIGKGILVDGSSAANTANTDMKVRIAVNESINTNNQVMVQVVPVGTKNATMVIKDNAATAGGTAAGNALSEGTTVTVQGKVAP